MTNTLLPAVFKDFDKFFVGFDDTYNRLAKLHDDVTKFVPNYPPYNIRKVEENKYVVELAVAGFARQDIEITFEDGKLIVKGNTQDDTENFLFKGIANRAFTRTFALDDQIEIRESIANYYEKELKNSNFKIPKVSPNALHARHLFPIGVGYKNRDLAMKILVESGIGVTVNYRAVTTMK